jgi:N-acetylneuraminate lyase
VAGAFICGSTGESASLTIEEKKSITVEWINCAKGNPDFKIILFLGENSLSECKSLAKFASENGIDGLAFTSPSYFKPTNLNLLVDCCTEVAASAPNIPFYYYHIPVFTNVHFPMIELLKLVDGNIKNFAGIKYSHEDVMDFLSCLQYKDGKYDMMWGRDENLLSALSLGACVAVGSTYNYAAPLYNKLITAFEKNNLEEARKLQMQSIDMIRLLSTHGGISVGKSFMKVIGFDCGEARLPLGNMNEASFDSFKQNLKSIQFNDYCCSQNS